MRLFRRERRATSGLAVPQDWLVDTLHGGTKTTAGERIDVNRSLQLADVFSCVNFICEQIASLPLKVFYEAPDGGILEAPQHRAYRMLHDSPNPVVPAFRFWSTVAAYLLLWGNAFIEKLRDQSGLVSELWLYHPSHVVVQWNEQLREKRFRIIGGIAPWSAITSGETQVKTQDEILHVYGISSDGLIGMSPIQQAREALGLAKGRERFEGEVYAQKPFVSGVIEHPNTLKDTVKLRESWKSIYGSEGKDRHGVAVLEEGAKYNQLTAPLQDMQFVESQKLSRTQIASIFKLPPAYIGGSMGDSLTYQTVESNEIWLARHTLSPICVNIQSFLRTDRGIFPFSAWYPEFVLTALLRGDSTARSKYYKVMSDIGAMTVDEIRELENLPPMEPEDIPTDQTPPDQTPPEEIPPEQTPAAISNGSQNGKSIPVISHSRRPPGTAQGG